MRKFKLLPILATILIVPAICFAGFTESLPKGTFLLDAGYLMSYVDSRWDNHGEEVPLIDEVERFEPGAGKQGILIPEVEARFQILALQLHYGVLDNLLVGVGIPIIMRNEVEPNFRWEEGDYMWNLGRSYTEQDFWDWVESMGDHKPGDFDGNKGKLADIILASRYRFTDHFQWWKDHDMAMALQLQFALPTGTYADPELMVAAGTTSRELQSNGDLCFHLGYDKFFNKSLDGRLTLGADVFYEHFLPDKRNTPTGKIHPLMLNYDEYVGKTYMVYGGDFSGVSVQADVVPFKGPILNTWLSRSNPEAAKKFPPLLSMSFRYTFKHMQQTDWESNSDIWDWDREKLWRPGYKQILFGQANFGLLRVGLPMIPYVSYSTIAWLPGKNTPAASVFGVGTKVLMKFW